jgi:transcriptional regulator with XRE-family HTH domain
MKEYYAHVLSKLKSARHEAGLTQKEVSISLGMSHTFMNKCESGERSIDIAELWVIAGFYDKPLSYFEPHKRTK